MPRKKIDIDETQLTKGEIRRQLLGSEFTQKQDVVFRYLARLMLAIPNATLHTLRDLIEDGSPFRQCIDGLEGTSRQSGSRDDNDPNIALLQNALAPLVDKMRFPRGTVYQIRRGRGRMILVDRAK